MRTDREMARREVPHLQELGQRGRGGASFSLVVLALRAVGDLFSEPFRAVLLRSLAWTLASLAVLGIAAGKLIAAYLLLPHAPWLATVLHVIADVAIFAALIFFVTPVSFVVASLFFDELAERIELDLGGGAGRGRRLPLAEAAWIGVEFAALSLGVNVAALFLSVLPGLNALIFFGANAYLLGRGFFDMAALRHLSRKQVQLMRRRHGGRIFLAGCLCAALTTVPLLNLLTPLFATALLVRLTWSLLEAP